jgi:endonuclease/exonuclease/phosphatase family metal-dependent hydrolase
MKFLLKKFIPGLSLIVIIIILNLITGCKSEEAMNTPNFPTLISGPLKLLTYNIHYGANANGVFNLGAVVETIRKSGANIIALQEVDRVWGERSLYYDEPRFIAEHLSMNYVFGATLKRDPYHPGSGEFGIMLLSKYPIIHSDFRLLPSTLEQRGCLLGWIQTPEGNIPVACTHLGLSALDRENQIKAILDWLPPQDDVLLLGDFNTEAGANELGLLEGRLNDLKQGYGLRDIGTFFYNGNWIRIDYIFEGYQWRAANCHVLTDQSSDHLPVYVEIEPVMN